MRKFLYATVMLLAMAQLGAALYVGTAPGVRDLGEVRRGQTVEVKFYIVTNAENPFTISPSFTRPQASFMRQGDSSRYDFDPEQTSQEDISDWVEFTQESYSVDPDTTSLVSLENGGATSVQGEVTYFLEVPQDAEPGYHVGAVNMNPSFTAGGAGTGVQTFGVTQYLFVFRVPGEARRDVRIERVEGIRTGEDKARMDYIIRNEGTVTTRISRAETKVFNRFGNLSGTVTTGGRYLSPGETRVIKAFWRANDLEEGEYRVRGEMDYITGSAFIDETVDLGEYIEVRGTGDGEESQGDSVSLWLVLMLLVLLAAVMYYLEVNPVTIIAAVGAAGISYYIYKSGLPLPLVILPLGIAAAALYAWYR